jgi:outer membrane protein assembly factor BamA
VLAPALLAVRLFTLVVFMEAGEKKTELNFIPVVGGDSDIGLGLGVVGDLARLQPDYTPYRWRLEVAALLSGRLASGGEPFTIPFQDYYLLFTLPQLTASRRLRLELRPSYTDERIQRFYGVGNASPEPADRSFAHTRYERRRVAGAAAARIQVAEHVYLRPGVEYTRNWVIVAPDSLLAEQRANGPEKVRALLDGPLHHTVVSGELALQYDSRDNETVTRNGSLHQARFLFSPRFPGAPYQYGEANVTLRIYRSPVRWLQLAGRLVGDALFGDPPFYELTRVEGSSVLGGGKGIRGVPGQRYYGKVKTYGNFEVRADLFQFKLRGKPFQLGVAGFFDGGRVWSDFNPTPDLDGTGVGLKYGAGGGLRLQEGTTFVVRADIAWSPDAHPIGAYFGAGELF